MSKLEKPNSYRAGPNERGRFGIYGGRFVPETLMPLILKLEKAYEEAKADPAFKAELDHLLKHYVGRPSPLYFAERLTEALGGAKVYFKRDELNHTGAHKINNVLGQILLARRMGKKRIIAETGAGAAWRRDRNRLRAVRPRLRRLHGRGRRRAAEAERLSHEDAGRGGAAGRARRAHAQGRDERGFARLGHQRARHLLLHRHRRRPASLSGHGARLPVRDRRGDAGADARSSRAACRTAWSPASAAARTRSASFIRSSTSPRSRCSGSKRPATGSTSPTATPPRSTAGGPACCTATAPICCRTDDGQILEGHSISAGLDYPGRRAGALLAQ